MSNLLGNLLVCGNLLESWESSQPFPNLGGNSLILFKHSYMNHAKGRAT